MRRWLMAIGLAGLIGMDGAAMAQSGQDVTVRAYRYYRAEGGKTLVTAIVEVPYYLLQASDSATLKYGVLVTILDDKGTRLTDANWAGRARSEMKQAGAAAVEILDFPVTSGTFRIAVDVTDSVSGKHFTGSTDVVAWSTTPKTSDLLLSPSMRLVAASDTAPKPRPGERLWGNTMVTASTRLRLTPARSKAYYLLEAYSATGDSGTMSVRVADSAGRVLLNSKPQAVKVAPPGSVLKGQLDLEGLPEGRYTLTVKLALGQRTEELSDQLVMANFVETMDKERERLASLRETDEGYFGLMNDAQLDEAEAPLSYIEQQSALNVWKTDLSLEAKQRFLVQFWAKRDPTPSTARNEAREGFYREIEAVNQLYKESGRAARVGWKTDRGRIRIRNGPPSDVLDRRTSLGKAQPYEVWRYTSGKERYYIFVDRTGFGNYELMATNDLRESSRAGWKDQLGPDAVTDISRFLNIDFFRNDAGAATGTDTRP